MSQSAFRPPSGRQLRRTTAHSPAARATVCDKGLNDNIGHSAFSHRYDLLVLVARNNKSRSGNDLSCVAPHSDGAGRAYSLQAMIRAGIRRTDDRPLSVRTRLRTAGMPHISRTPKNARPQPPIYFRASFFSATAQKNGAVRLSDSPIAFYRENGQRPIASSCSAEIRPRCALLLRLPNAPAAADDVPSAVVNSAVARGPYSSMPFTLNGLPTAT